MIKLLASFLLLVTVSSNLIAETITLTTGEFAPWTSKKLKKYGVSNDIVQQIFQSQGIDIVIKFYPWNRAYALVQHGKADVSGYWFKNKKRAAELNFSDPLYSINNVIIYKKGKQLTFNEINDLKQYKIALVKTYSYGDEIDAMVKNNEVNAKLVKSDLLALKQMLYRDTFDIFICNESTAKKLFKENFTLEEQKMFKIYPKPALVSNVYLLVSNNIKNSQKILTAFNKGLKEFKEKGLIKKMIDDSYHGVYKQ